MSKAKRSSKRVPAAAAVMALVMSSVAPLAAAQAAGPTGQIVKTTSNPCAPGNPCAPAPKKKKPSNPCAPKPKKPSNPCGIQSSRA